jgi:hypothetical protein
VTRINLRATRRVMAVALSTGVGAFACLATASSASADTCHVWGGGFIPLLSNYTTCDTARGLQSVTRPGCRVWGGGYISGLSNYTTCDTAKGFAAVSEGPDRSPDYVVYDSSQQAGQFGLGTTLIRTRDGRFYVGVSGNASPRYLGVTLPLKQMTLPVLAVGYVGSPRGYNPSDSEIDSFVSGVTANITFGLGAGVRLVASPGAHQVGVEYVAGGVLGVSYGLGTSVEVPQPASPASQGSTPPAPARVYHVRGQRLGVWERSGPGTGYPAVGALADGSAVTIECQTTSSSGVGSGGRISYIWDRLADGHYVTDWFIDTAAVGAYSAGLPACS